MRLVTKFPSGYPHIKQDVAKIEFYQDLERLDFGDPTNSNVDFIIELKDKRIFCFTAFTVRNVQAIMDEQQLGALVVPGFLLVREIRLKHILDAIEECLGQSETYGLEHYGILAR